MKLASPLGVPVFLGQALWFQVSGFGCQANSSQAGKLGSYLAEGIVNNLAFYPPGLPASKPIRFFLTPDT
jgi:hypothetical protein